MPRKAAHSKKGSTRSVKKPVEEEEIEEEQDSPSVKSRGKESERERSRRSSTAAQTAASVADSRSTRTRTTRQDSSPSDSRRSSGRDAEATRVRSSRRSTGRVNYKESDGEEGGSTPKNEDTFESNEEFDDSDSDEKNKSKGKRGAKTPAKGRSAAAKPKKSRGRGGGRGRPPKRKGREGDDEEEGDEDKPIDVSDDEDSPKKVKDDEADTELETKKEPTAKSNRKSRGISRSAKTETPVSKRPSRNKQVKKYTEVDEDFDDDEEVIEVKSEDEKKADQEKKGSSSRKRKRESEVEASKRPKKEHKSAEASQDSDDAQDDSKDTKAESSEEKEADESCEPMDVDEVVSEPEPEKEEKQKSSEEKQSPVKEAKEVADKPTSVASDVSATNKEGEHESESNHVQNSDPQKATTQGEGAKSSNLSPEKKDNTPGVIKSVEKETASTMALDRNSDSKRAGNKPENTFLTKGQSSDVSMNGEGDKSREPPAAEKGFHFQNSSAPRANGEPERVSPGQKSLIHSDREYISNKSLGVDFVRGLKGNSVRFGIASYNLSSVTSPKEKLAHALDKDVSVVCLQNVSKSLFHDTLESFFEASGFKAVVNWLSDCESHLVTFYKTSVFRVKKVDEASVKKLIQKKLESSSLDENEKLAISECFDSCGHALFAHLDFGHEEKASLTVANVKIPSSAAGLHALQLVCLNQELAELSEPSSTRVLLCGEFNAPDTEVPYQLLRHGKPVEEILAEFKSETDSVQNAAILKLLKNIAHRPSVKLSSCYALVLGRELTIPESKTTYPDLLWVSADGIHTVGIVDLPLNYRERLSQGLVPLKADIAVTLPFPPKTPV